MKLWFKMIFLGLLPCLFVIAPPTFAGTTGKIAGKILDAETKEPLPGVNVLLAGTRWGAATDSKGNYSIMNIPPGAYTLKVNMLGYKEIRMEQVRVQVDFTRLVNFEMQPTILEASETVTVIAERPMVQMDMTSSLTTVAGEEIKNLPVHSITDVLELQAGIVRSGNQLHIRGGRAGEVAFWVDGVATTDVFSGNSGVTVENSAVEELQVVSGTFNAEYGNAMSGVINIVTKEGGPKYQGQVKTYIGDYVSDRAEFRLLKKVTAGTEPGTGKSIAVGEYENPLSGLNPIYNGEFSLSGPVPLAAERLNFFVNARYVRESGHLYGRNWFTSAGNPGDSALVAMNPSQRFSAQGKLTFQLSRNLKISYNLFYNSWKNERTYSHAWKYVPGSLRQQRGQGFTQIFMLNHVLSPATFYEVRLNRFYNDYQTYLFDDPTAAPRYLVLVYADTTRGIETEIFDPNTIAGAAKFESIKKNRIKFNYIIDPAGPLGYIHPDSSAAPTAYSFQHQGTDLWRQKRSTAYWVGKFDLTSQITSSQQLKLGIEYRLHQLKLDQYALRPKMNENQTEQLVPFVPEIPIETSVYRDVYDRRPREFSAYIQDKIELSQIIFNLGLRFDYFDAKSVVPADPSDPDIYRPMKNENIYRRWQNPPQPLVGKEFDAWKAGFEPFTPAERRQFMHRTVQPKMQLSPRLGIAYPITDKGVIHFSYGHFFQIPEFQYLYSKPDFKLTGDSGFFIFGNADLHPQKTVMYEIGLQQALTATISADVTLFYRDVRDWVGTSRLIDTGIPSVKYSRYENKDYENVRGITVQIENRLSQRFSARLDYAFQIAEGTYSNPNDAYNDFVNNEAPQITLIPMNWDQNHTLNGSLIYQRAQWTAALIGRYWTGRPYTPGFPQGEKVGAAARTGLMENSDRLPAQKSVDLALNRRFTRQPLQIEIFLNIYNLFDQRNATNVYSDTGAAEYTTSITPAKIPYNSRRIGTIEEYVNQPGWYTLPREIQLGFTIGF